MTRVAYSEVSRFDILDQTGFKLIMGAVPLAGITDALTYKCQNVSIPGFGNEAFEAMMHGHVTRHRGRKTYPRSLSATFYEEANFSTLNQLRAWHEFVVGSESGNSGGYRDEYSVDAYLLVYDTTGKEVARHTMEYFFPQDISDTQLDGSSSNAVSISVTFSYDRFLPNGVPLL